MSDNQQKGDIVFEYKGRIYNRPIGRGINFVLPDGDFGIHYRGEVRELSLEDVIPEGDFEMEITVRRMAS